MGKLVIEIKEVMKDTDGSAYEVKVEADKINKKHCMKNLATAILRLAEGEDKDFLMSIFTMELILQDK